MSLTLFLQGLVLGFSIAAPVGPIGVLCIRRSIGEGALVGFLCGLGAATADAIYEAIGAAGVKTVSDFLERQQFWLGLLGGIFLCYLGAKTFRGRPAETAARQTKSGLAASYLTTLALTLTNPMTIFSFAGMFAGFGLGAGQASWSDVAVIVGGVFVGSAAWWLILSGLASRLRTRFDHCWHTWLNRLSGTVIAGFGLWQLFKLGTR